MAFIDYECDHSGSNAIPLAVRRLIGSSARLACCQMLRMSPGISAPMSEQGRASKAKRVAVRFTPLNFVSSDHGKLARFN